MKVVIFAGGLGTRLFEETSIRPKPMVEIGGKPILWHIMKIYEYYGFNEFIVCLGYKGYMIKEYFMNFYLHNSDVTIDLKSNDIQIHKSNSDDFKVSLIDTGLNTMTAGRLKKIRCHLDNSNFMLTYGDGVSDINIQELVEYHREHGKVATVTTVQPPGRFGSLDMTNKNQVTTFIEKAPGDGGWINGGFFVLKPEVFSYLPDKSDSVMWENEPLRQIASDGELMAYKHHGFWKCMDHLRDMNALETIWNSKDCQWRIWS